MPAIDPLVRPDPDQAREVLRLYQAQGWWPETDTDTDLIGRIIQGSHCFFVARQRGRIIGMGRALSDRASDAYIQDVAVAEAHRGRGIGSRIIRAILHRLRSDGLSWIGVIAERDSHPFYRRFGFRPMDRATPMLAAHGDDRREDRPNDPAGHADRSV